MGIADFLIKIGLNTAQVSTGTEKAKKDIKGLADFVDNKLGTGLGKFAGRFSVIGAAIAGFTAGRGIQKAAGDLNDLADKMDTTAATAQRLMHAAGVTGASPDSVESSMGFVRKTQSQALQGNKGTIDDFARLGVTIDDLKNKSADEIFLQIAKGVETGAINASNFSSFLAVMGKQANSLVPAFKDGFASAAEDLGKMGIAGRGVINDLDQLDKTWNRLVQNGKTYGKTFVANLAAGLSGLSKLWSGATHALFGDKETASDVLADRELMFDKDNDAALDQADKLERKLAQKKGVKTEKAKADETKKAEQEKKDAEEARKLREKNLTKLSDMRLSTSSNREQIDALTRRRDGLTADLGGAKSPLERQKMIEEILDAQQKLNGLSKGGGKALSFVRASDKLSNIGLFTGAADRDNARFISEQLRLSRDTLSEQRKAVERLGVIVQRMEAEE